MADTSIPKDGGADAGESADLAGAASGLPSSWPAKNPTIRVKMNAFYRAAFVATGTLAVSVFFALTSVFGVSAVVAWLTAAVAGFAMLQVEIGLMVAQLGAGVGLRVAITAIRLSKTFAFLFAMHFALTVAFLSSSVDQLRQERADEMANEAKTEFVLSSAPELSAIDSSIRDLSAKTGQLEAISSQAREKYLGGVMSERDTTAAARAVKGVLSAQASLAARTESQFKKTAAAMTKALIASRDSIRHLADSVATAARVRAEASTFINTIGAVQFALEGPDAQVVRWLTWILLLLAAAIDCFPAAAAISLVKAIEPQFMAELQAEAEARRGANAFVHQERSLEEALAWEAVSNATDPNLTGKTHDMRKEAREALFEFLLSRIRKNWK